MISFLSNLPGDVPWRWVLVGIIGIGICIALEWGSGSRKQKLARSYWGGSKEIRNATQRALSQLKRPKRNSAALYIGIDLKRLRQSEIFRRTYLSVKVRLQEEEYRQKYHELITTLNNCWRLIQRGGTGVEKEIQRLRFYIPDIQRGIAVCGAPGCGKTFSVIDPSLRSAIEQGYPIVLYDFKYPAQASTLAAYAQFFHGYKIYIFAPGYDESNVCNPLEFLRDPLDGETSRQIAVTMNKNFNLGSGDKRDPFFDTAADQLLEAIFMLVRSFRLSDLLSCQSVLSLDNIGFRLMQWAGRSLEEDIGIAFLTDRHGALQFFLGNEEFCSVIVQAVYTCPKSGFRLNLLEVFYQFVSGIMEYITSRIREATDAQRGSRGMPRRTYEPGTDAYDHFVIENLANYQNLPRLSTIINNKIVDCPSPEKIAELGINMNEQISECFRETLSYLEYHCKNMPDFVKSVDEDEWRKQLGFIMDVIAYAWNLHPDYNPSCTVLRTKRLKEWIKAAFGQLISVSKAERTVSSIVGIANNNLTRFVKPNIARHFVGKSDIPLYLDSKVLLIFGLDRERRDTVGPLLATVLHLIVNYNLTSRPRQTPLVVALDELPTVYLPQLQNWLNESRSDGFCGQIGFQNMNQLEKAYGKEMARSILTGCNTKFLFNPGEPESAENFSKFLGEEEVIIKQKSRSRGKGGWSLSISEQDRTRKLFEPAQFLKLPTGSCVIISPGYSNKKEANIPVLRQMKLHNLEIELFDEVAKLWPYCREAQIQKVGGRNIQDERLDLFVRQRFAKSLLAYKPSDSDE